MKTLPIVATAVVSAIAAVATTWPLARDLGSATLTSGEVLLTAWQINAFHQVLLSSPLHWADANIFFPYAGTATYNDLLLSHALLTLPFAWTASPVAALNAALLGGIVLCGVCAHLFIDELVDDPWAAMAGGTLFALAPYRFLHLVHVSIAAAWAIPLFFWALLRHMREPSWPRAVLVAVSGVLVALSSLYHAAYVAPILPLVLLVAARRGPGGRPVWWPLIVTGSGGLAVLAWFMAPFAATLQTFGTGAATDDLLRYGADLLSFGRRPDFLGGTSDVGAEAHLYPGAALALLSAVGLALAVWSGRTVRAWWRVVGLCLLILLALSSAGIIWPSPLPGLLDAAWRTAVVLLIWVGPVAAAAWAVVYAREAGARSPEGALRFAVAGAAWSFVFALGPEAQLLGERLGPGPYALLSSMSSFFEGTRVPARFGGVSMLFLAVLAAATITYVRRAGHRMAGAGLGAAAVLVCLIELPVPAFPAGRPLVDLPDLRDPVYEWVRTQPERIAILELPDWPSDAVVHYEHRDWRALRYMLASKQHGRRLVNGTGRIEPFLWQRFRSTEMWSDDFFDFIAAYLPVDYALVHEAGIPVAEREALWARLDNPASGWRPVFRSPGTRVYSIDRTSGRGAIVDRIFLRQDLAPRAEISFLARVAGDATPAGEIDTDTAIIDLMLDGQVVESWTVGREWQSLQATLPVGVVAPDSYDAQCRAGQSPCLGWPKTGVLLRWRSRGPAAPSIEITSLSIQPARLSAD